MNGEQGCCPAVEIPPPDVISASDQSNKIPAIEIKKNVLQLKSIDLSCMISVFAN